MSEKSKKKIVWQQYVGTVFLILVGAVCGVYMVSYINGSGDKPLYEEILCLVGFFAGIYLAIFVHMIVHEAGHLVFGLLSGYQFSSFRVASFMWVKENDKIRFSRLSVAGTGGQCLMIPPDMKNGKIPVVLYNLGGSIMNVMVGSVFLGIYFLCPDESYISVIMQLFAVVGFMIAVMNGVPMRMGAVDNDGYNAFSLTRNVDAMESFWLQLKVVEQTAKGVRLKDMPEEWFTVPKDEAMKNSMVATRGVFTCNRLMDAENFEEADRLMAHMLAIESGMVGIHRNLLVCDRMYIELITANRKEVLNEMLDKEQKKFMKLMKKFPSVLRTGYVYALLCEEDVKKAREVKISFEKYAEKYPYPKEIAAERRLMEIAEELAENGVIHLDFEEC